MKKRVFILAYARANLGDDLFIAMLLKKYPEVQFYINIEQKEHAEALKGFGNLTIYQEKERELTKQNAKDYDAYIYVGGSIFMEGGVVYNITEEFLEFMKECKKVGIPFYYISANFGPYQTQEYVELAKEIYQNCTSISFRDTYSNNLFQGISSVRYVPDLVFSYVQEDIEKEPNTVGITVIDLSIRKEFANTKEDYYEMLEENIKEYIKQEKKVTLFSFCKYEGDEKAIQELVKRLPAEIMHKVNVINYNGEIDSFLREYAKMEYTICARFHAMVLSVVMGQKCEIISYSNKIDRVIEDLALFEDNIIYFNQINSKIKMPLEQFKEVDSKKVQEIAKKAKEQLEIW